MSENNDNSKRGPGSVTGILFMLMGILIFAIGFGLIPVDPSSIHAPGWVIAIFGGIFLVTGIWVIFLQAMSRDAMKVSWINDLFGLLMMLSVSILCLWIGFGPGERFFTHYGGHSGRPTALLTDPILGRIFFGGFGVLISGVTIAFAIIQGRKLFGRRSAQ